MRRSKEIVAEIPCPAGIAITRDQLPEQPIALADIDHVCGAYKDYLESDRYNPKHNGDIANRLIPLTAKLARRLQLQSRLLELQAENDLADIISKAGEKETD